MTSAIVFSSKTGNTRLLAEAIQSALPQGQCLYFGPPDEKALGVQRIYLGFWTDKGGCDGETASFLPRLTSQELFLFGTAGFGQSEEYFAQILGRVTDGLPQGVSLIGSFLCQGKMPPAVRKRYEAMEEGPRRQALLENFDRALSHPSQEDLDRLAALVRGLADG